MSSKIKVDNIADQGNNNMLVKCGSTLTIGKSGDTVAIASGATTSGMGRTGTVDWQTGDIKTADFSAANGEGYFVNTTSGAVTVSLPSSPSAGNIVAIADYAGTSATNNITINRNSSPFQGGTQNGVLSTNRQTATFVYVDGTQGWVPVNSNDQGFLIPLFVTATGGTIKTCGNFKTHIFTGPGTFCVSCGGNPLGTDTVDYFVVAGGGGTNSGGGGAGGFRVSNSVGCVPAPTMSPLTNPTGLPVSTQGYPITVGAGGTAGSGPSNQGSQSIFSTITSTGGGHGESNDQTTSGGPGGSGGGGGRSSTTNPGGGTGNTPPVSPPQGNNGASTGASVPYHGGSGGGAGAAATPSNGATTSTAGAGSFIADAFIGGCAPSFGTPGPVSSTRYFSGGGGGSRAGTTGAGGSGIVIIRYKYQ